MSGQRCPRPDLFVRYGSPSYQDGAGNISPGTRLIAIPSHSEATQSLSPASLAIFDGTVAVSPFQSLKRPIDTLLKMGLTAAYRAGIVEGATARVPRPL